MKLNDIREKILNSNFFLFKNRYVKKLLNIILTESFIRYLVIGFTTFFMQVLGFFLLFNVLKLTNTISNIIAVLISMVFNFLMSNYWTFKAGPEAKTKKLSKYILLGTFNYFFNILAFQLFANIFFINEYISIVLITGMIVCWNYFLYRFWIFKK